jgi:hypothetical protein
VNLIVDASCAAGSLSVNVRNSGTVAAPPTSLQIDFVRNAGGLIVESSDGADIPSLGPNEDWNDSFGTPGGNWDEIFVRADAGEVVEETDDANTVTVPREDCNQPG